MMIKKPIPHKQHVDAEILFLLFVESCLDSGFSRIQNGYHKHVALYTYVARYGAKEQLRIQIPCFHQTIGHVILVIGLHQLLKKHYFYAFRYHNSVNIAYLYSFKTISGINLLLPTYQSTCVLSEYLQRFYAYYR